MPPVDSPVLSFSILTQNTFKFEKHWLKVKRNPSEVKRNLHSVGTIESWAEIRQFWKSQHVLRQPSWRILAPSFYTKCTHLRKQQFENSTSYITYMFESRLLQKFRPHLKL